MRCKSKQNRAPPSKLSMSSIHSPKAFAGNGNTDQRSGCSWSKSSPAPACAGWAIEPRNHRVRGADAVYGSGRKQPTSVRWTVTDCPFLPDWIGTRPTFTVIPVGRRIRAALLPPRTERGTGVHRHVHPQLEPLHDQPGRLPRSWGGKPVRQPRRPSSPPRTSPGSAVMSVQQEAVIAAPPQPVVELLTNGSQGSLPRFASRSSRPATERDS
jgi:hypothetical protein